VAAAQTARGAMELAEKLRRLRIAEGMRRGLWRTLTQIEVIHAMRQEIGVSLSQAYLSQLESGRRRHLTSATREALARFYHVHPGYLVSDPPGVVSAPDPASIPARQLDHMQAETLARLASAPEPARVARLLDWLLRLPPEELAALERRMDAADTPGA
jgi:transcriptional regulator with XRE-family HTH domain